MNTRLLLVLLSVGFLASAGAEAQTRTGSIQGVWQVVEVRMSGPNPATITIPEPRPNLTIITARHYIQVHVEGEGGPFAGEAGTYDIKGNLITMRPIAAKNPAVMTHGAFSTWSFTLTGDTLLITAERNQNGPVANPVTVKAVRVE
jgi:hypothetical protein